MHTQLLTIGETARRAGLRPSALRYYESVGLLEPRDRAGGRRRYGPDALERLALIRLAQDAGFTIAEMRKLLHGLGASTPASERWQALARHKLVEIDVLIERAVRMRALLGELLACDCVNVEECATQTVQDARCMPVV